MFIECLSNLCMLAGKLIPHCSLCKNAFSEKAFFVTYNIIISHGFPENIVQKISRICSLISTIFVNLMDFLTFPYYKETNDVTYNRRHLPFFPFKVL